MKYLLIIWAVFWFANTGFAQEENKHSHQGERLDNVPDLKVKPADGDVIRVEVNGLVCDFCAQAIDKVFRKNEAVADVAVDLNIKIVELALKKDGKLADDTLSQLILDSGYNVVKITRYQLPTDVLGKL